MTLIIAIGTIVAAYVVWVVFVCTGHRWAGKSLMRHNTATGGIQVHDYLIWSILALFGVVVLVMLSVAVSFLL